MHFAKKESRCGICVIYSVRLDKEIMKHTAGGHAREILFIRGINIEAIVVAVAFIALRALSSSSSISRSCWA